MRRIAVCLLLVAGGLVRADQPIVTPMPTPGPCCDGQGPLPMLGYPGEERGLFESDRAFPGFIGPISNPVLTKDPRSLTEARALFVNNWFPEKNSVLGGGHAQIYGLQLRLALTERLTLIADKDGYASLNARNLPNRSGFLNTAIGLKYTFIRDVENQFLVTGGFQYELRSGEEDVFQEHGDGLFTVFGVVGKQFGCWHVLWNGGYQFAPWDSQNSSFVYTQLHIDRQLFGWLYPLAELNCFYYNSGGNRLPAALGEGDGLINFGTNGQAGATFFSVALGLKAQVCPNLDVGIAWETPLGRKDIMLQRVLFECIFRY